MIAVAVALAAAAALPPAFRGELVAPGVVSTPLPESGAAFSPDGKELYFTVRTPTTTSTPLAAICVSRLRGGAWQKPEILPFSGRGFDYAPALSPDGDLLIFSSRRPPRADIDLWMVERKGGAWGEPRRLPDPINSDADEQGASIAPDGSLYFSSERPGGAGGVDLYRAPATGPGRWGPPVAVAELNTPLAETQPHVTRDGRHLFFVSVGRSEDRIAGGSPYPRGDIWVSDREGERWGAPRHLSDAVNTPASESYPVVSSDGRWLYFTSEISFAITPLPRAITIDEVDRLRRGIQNGGGNLYRIPLAEALRAP